MKESYWLIRMIFSKKAFPIIIYIYIYGHALLYERPKHVRTMRTTIYPLSSFSPVFLHFFHFKLLLSVLNYTIQFNFLFSLIWYRFYFTLFKEKLDANFYLYMNFNKQNMQIPIFILALTNKQRYIDANTNLRKEQKMQIPICIKKKDANTNLHPKKKMQIPICI